MAQKPTNGAVWYITDEQIEQILDDEQITVARKDDADVDGGSVTFGNDFGGGQDCLFDKSVAERLRDGKWVEWTSPDISVKHEEQVTWGDEYPTHTVVEEDTDDPDIDAALDKLVTAYAATESDELRYQLQDVANKLGYEIDPSPTVNKL
jgi:hypothetical protein